MGECEDKGEGPGAFRAFGKIKRLFRDCTITEKLDGTNAQILIPDDMTQPILVGSRNKWILPGKSSDNFGFAQFVYENAEDLVQLLGPGRHFGEWWGAGIQRRYDMSTKRFSLFNTRRWGHLRSTAYWDSDEAPKKLFGRVDCVPELYCGPFSEGVVRNLMHLLATHGSIAVPGFMEPEGVVVFHEHSGQLFKVTLPDDGHKGQIAEAA